MKRKINRFSISFASLFAVVAIAACSSNDDPERSGQAVVEYEIAVLPDIHFHDVFGEFQDEAFKGLPISGGSDRATIRTMAAQLASTRLFNENYFALHAALDDVLARGIELVILPGDFTDDGQPLHTRGLKKVLERYEARGLRFFAAPGNHDPTQPFGRPAGKPDFLNAEGRALSIYSHGTDECNNADKATICSDEVEELGYDGLLQIMAAYGFVPSGAYFYWESPYGRADLQDREYSMCSATSPKNCLATPDASYLVEPVEGLWLLSIDANVYVPLTDPDSGKLLYGSASRAGYNYVVVYKRHLLDWIESVVTRARLEGKQLIAFSHYPAAAYDDGQEAAIDALLGPRNSEVQRRPTKATVVELASRGLRLHISGHMHVNDTEQVPLANSEYFTNLHVPTIAGYIPSYKVLSVRSDDSVGVQTVELSNVEGFNRLFELYAQEYDNLQRSGAPELWDRSILKAETYSGFTRAHLNSLVASRYLTKDWIPAFRDNLLAMDGETLWQLVRYAIENVDDDCVPLQKCTMKAKSVFADKPDVAGPNIHRRVTQEFQQWIGRDLATDFYKVRKADRLALEEIGADRVCQYTLIADALSNDFDQPGSEFTDDPISLAEFMYLLKQVLSVIDAARFADPISEFSVDLHTGRLTGPAAANEFQCEDYLL